MTTRLVVADDVLGRIATRQWELFRRVKEGTLDGEIVLSSLQAIIQNEASILDIEKLDWKISSQVHVITVEEGKNFMEEVKRLGFIWNYGNHEDHPPTVCGEPSRRKKKARFRLAELALGPDLQSKSVGVARVYAEISGYDLATPWELLSFVQQSNAMRVIKNRVTIAALGGGVYWSWKDSGKTAYGNIQVNDFQARGNWSFNKPNQADTLLGLEKTAILARYVLLRERNSN